MIHFGTIKLRKILRTLLVSFEKKSHYNSRVSPHGARTTNQLWLQQQSVVSTLTKVR